MPQQHLDRLTSTDASFLHQEGAASHMHIGAVLLFEGPPPAFNDFLDHVRGRLHLVGRTADVIKSGGYKIHPEEIETALAGSAGSGAVAVTTLPSEYWGEVIIAVAEAAPADWPARAAAAAEVLAKFKRPRAYLVLDALPRNAQGKVPRAKVREIVLERWRLVDGAHPTLEKL